MTMGDGADVTGQACPVALRRGIDAGQRRGEGRPYRRAGTDHGVRDYRTGLLKALAAECPPREGMSAPGGSRLLTLRFTRTPLGHVSRRAGAGRSGR